MEYRELGRTGLKVGEIGLGTEHIERSPENLGAVLQAAVDAGVNYVDLLYIEPKGTDADFWEGFGPTLRACRDRLVLAAHWGGGPRYDLEYSERCFEDVLACLGNGYAEVALLTMVDTENKWKGWAHESVRRLRRYQEEGRVGYTGLSTHVAPLAIEAARSGLIDVLMYPLNVTSHAVEGAAEVCRACAEEGVGLVAMKPYRGGTLLTTEGKPSGITPAQCLAYVLSLAVAATVPGPKNLAEMQATLHYLEAGQGEKDYEPLLARAEDYLAGECTGCDHCLPCPEDIDIGQTVALAGWGGWAAEGSDEGTEVRIAYDALPIKASACVECGECEERCPFGVEIIAAMRRAVELFEGGG